MFIFYYFQIIIKKKRVKTSRFSKDDREKYFVHVHKGPGPGTYNPASTSLINLTLLYIIIYI